ncbi:MAG: DUF5004 domain-containing protein [Bacteroidia bacterium]|nr:DUF5004 domain-containing protein [Bacteroidia bacterium]
MIAKIKGPFLLALVMTLGLWACKPEPPTLDPPSSKLEGINDSFVLENVTQVDLLSALADELDVSDAYKGDNPMVISFSSTDFTWTIQENDSPNFMGTSGTWSFDDNLYPTLINMVPTGAVDTTVVTLDATIRTVDEYLKFTFSKGCGSGNTIGYKYEFRRM